jgi:predicted dehydrogenase
MTTDCAMTLRLGIIGCGRFVHNYHVPTLRRRDDLELIGVCDPSPSMQTRDLTRDLGAALVSDPNELVDGLRPDAVLVSSPHAMHADHIAKCLQARAHVLVDKPFVLTVGDATRLTALAADVGVVGAVAFNRRLDQGFRYARGVLASGTLGDLLHVETVQLGYPSDGWYGDPALGGGGPFTGRGTHMADAVPWLTGRSVNSVFAGLVPGPRADGVDLGGFIASDLGGPWWHATVRAGDPWNLDEVRLYGTLGYLVIRRPADQTFSWICEHRALDGEELGRSGLGQIQFALDDFVMAVTSGGAPACSFADAVPSVAIIEAAFAAARQGGPAVPLRAMASPGGTRVPPGAVSSRYQEEGS